MDGPTPELTPEVTPLLTGDDETVLALDTESVAVEKSVLVKVSTEVEGPTLELTPLLTGEDGTVLPVADDTADVAGAETGVELVRAETSELDGTTTTEVLWAGIVTEMVEVRVCVLTLVEMIV